MIYINDEPVSIEQIRSYKGSHAVYDTLKAALKRIDNIGFPITIKHPPGTYRVNARSGLKEGKRMIKFNRSEVFNTPDGTFNVRWADQAIPVAGGGKNYGSSAYIFRKHRILTENEIEEALFLIGISSVFRTGKLVVEDVAGDAKQIARNRAGEADINYLIYSENSPLTKERLMTLAMAWGIQNIDSMRGSIEAVKNALYDLVKLKESQHDSQFGYNAFIRSATGEEPTEFIECLALVTKAETSKAIAWDKRNFSWVLKGQTAKDNVELLVINPAQSDRRRELLAQLIAGDERMKTLLQGKEKKASQGIKKPGSDELSEDQKLFERFAALTEKEWGELNQEDFAEARKMAKVAKNVPDKTALEMCRRHFDKIKA